MCKSQDSAGDFCIILRVAKQAGAEKKRAVFCCLSALSAPEAASLRLPAHPRNCTDFALRALGFTPEQMQVSGTVLMPACPRGGEATSTASAHSLDARLAAAGREAVPARQSESTERCNWRSAAGSAITLIWAILPPVIVNWVT